MTEQHKERLSAFMDGELDDAPQVVEALKQDGELQAIWQRYHLIRDALHQRLAPSTDPAFVEQVSAAIAKEPTIIAPRRRKAAIPKLLKPAAGMAIAASIAVVAVLGVQGFYQTPQTTPLQLAGQAAPEASQTVAANALPANVERRLDADQESKLNGYLVRHNEYSASSHVQGILPYTRIVSYTPGKRIED